MDSAVATAAECEAAVAAVQVSANAFGQPGCTMFVIAVALSLLPTHRMHPVLLVRPHTCLLREYVPPLQAALQHPRPLRKHAPQIARDALAVLTGLRPAAMLDYAVLDAATLRAVGAALRTAAPDAGSCSLQLIKF